jgi:hypothetical protein
MSDARAENKLEFMIEKRFLIPATKTVTKGFGVKYSGANNQVENCAAGDGAIGIALESGVAGDSVRVALLSGATVIPIKVGTGGATLGSYAITVADGFTNRALGGGTTAREIAGVFLDTGVAGDEIGLMVCKFVGVSA